MYMLCRQSTKQYSETPRTRAMLTNYHTTHLSSNQCGSSLVQPIDAPLPVVWSLIRRFEKPQGYKRFVKHCSLLAGDGSSTGSVREVTVTSGLPAGVSVERLDKLDDDKHVLKFSIIGGDHRLLNYSSTITLHEEEEVYGGKTVAIESYVVDIPEGSSGEDTCSFANTIIGCNLRSLAKITQDMGFNNKAT
ncbi:abscisic acid receptor PYL12-like [Lotus japonicus]|uniref:abscisic acid receptor PYL12-like n=1 Tax=Lotus japonicus TaxID=34305 RepID=UPI00258E585D|nr:abscisic acid receptor PYL12-like [Lotus japonicus]